MQISIYKCVYMYALIYIDNLTKKRLYTMFYSILYLTRDRKCLSLSLNMNLHNPC